MTGFTCSVNGTIVTGAFYKIGFVENENIEFVGEHNDENIFITVAARSASQRIVWTIPYHDCGHIANTRSVWKWGFIFSGMGAFALAVMLLIVFGFNPAVPIGYRVIPPICIFFVGLLINYWVRSHFTKFCKNATHIFAALGYPKPGEVDLQADHEVADQKFRISNPEAPRMFSSWCYRF